MSLLQCTFESLSNAPVTIDFSALTRDTSSPFNLAEIPFLTSEISVNSRGWIDSSSARVITAWAYGWFDDASRPAAKAQPSSAPTSWESYTPNCWLAGLEFQFYRAKPNWLLIMFHHIAASSIAPDFEASERLAACGTGDANSRAQDKLRPIIDDFQGAPGIISQLLAHQSKQVAPISKWNVAKHPAVELVCPCRYWTFSISPERRVSSPTAVTSMVTGPWKSKTRL